MATIGEILQKRWYPALYGMSGGDDNYETLVWYPENTVPKPTEAEIRALSDEVDAELALDAMRAAQQDIFNLHDRPDRLLTAVQALLAAVEDLRAKAQATEPLATEETLGLDELQDAITYARAQTY